MPSYSINLRDKILKSVTYSSILFMYAYTHLNWKTRKLKDRRNNLEKAGVVYKIECKECESNYVGEKGRCLQDRIDDHKKDVRKKTERSNIYQHVRNTGHEFKFEEMKVLDEEANAIKRRFLGVHTLMNRDTINRAADISPFFHPMLKGEGYGDIISCIIFLLLCFF